MRQPIVGFAPDLDPATPGILVDCDAIVPTLKGMAAANVPVNVGLPVLPTTPTSGFVAKLLDGTRRLFAGSATKIYEAVSAAWVDRSAVGNYTGAGLWEWAVFGNATLATNNSQPVQASLPGASFAAIAGAPIAQNICVASGFVMVTNMTNGALGAAPDGWQCSALFDHTSWTPSAATQSAAGRMVDSPGPIVATAALGSDVVAYKGNSMYLGRYIGPPIIWAWQRIPGDTGCIGQKAVVEVVDRHFFVGNNDIYVFDGTAPQSIGAPVKNFFFGDLAASFRHLVVAASDLERELVYFYYPSRNSADGGLDRCLIYNIKTNSWGFWRVGNIGPVQAALEYTTTGVVYDAFYGTATYDTLPEVSYDSPFWLVDAPAPAVFIGGVLQSLTGEPTDSYWVTGDYGDVTDFSFLKRLTPRWTTEPLSASGRNFYKLSSGSENSNDQQIELSRGRFDFRRSARWHSFRVDQVGPNTLHLIDIDLTPDTPE